MFDVYYNDSKVMGRGTASPGAGLEARAYTSKEVDESGVAFHLNTRIERSGDLYVIRAFEAVYNGSKFSVTRDTSFSHPGENFSCWLLAKEPGPLSVVVVDDAIINYGMYIPEYRQRYYDQFGHLVLKLFTTIRGCCEPGKQCEAEELCIDMQRFIMDGELPADLADLPASSGAVEAFQESNTKLFQDVRASLNLKRASDNADAATAAAVSVKKWADLSAEEQSFVMRKTAEKLGIVSS